MTTERSQPHIRAELLETLYLEAANPRHFMETAKENGFGRDHSDRRALATAMSKIDFYGDPKSDAGSDWMVARGENTSINFRGRTRHLRHVLYEIFHDVELPHRQALLQYAGKPKSVNPIQQRLPEFGENPRRHKRQYETSQGTRVKLGLKPEDVVTVDMAISTKIEFYRIRDKLTRAETARMLAMDYQRYMKLVNYQLKNWKINEVLLASEVFNVDIRRLMERPTKQPKSTLATGEGKGLVGGSPYTKTDYRDSDSWEPEHA